MHSGHLTLEEKGWDDILSICLYNASLRIRAAVISQNTTELDLLDIWEFLVLHRYLVQVKHLICSGV